MKQSATLAAQGGLLPPRFAVGKRGRHSLFHTRRCDLFLGDTIDCGLGPIQELAMRAAHRTSAAKPREVLTGMQRTKIDVADDRQFYSLPRFVYHCDTAFRLQLTELYRKLIPPESTILDLCSSWTSHLPDDVQYSLIIGHGLNAQELARNKRLDKFFVRDLNKFPDNWAFEDAAFDAVLCCCSIQYIQQPERVFMEISRVLKPGGICCISFTDRLFYEKAIAAWRDSSSYARMQLVKQYFFSTSTFDEPEVVVGDSFQPSGGLAKIWIGVERLIRGRAESDPFFAVYAQKKSSPFNDASSRMDAQEKT